MSKSKRSHKKHGQSHHTPSSTPEALVAEVDRIAAELASTDTPGPLWGQLHKQLVKAGVDAKEIMPVVMGRNLEALTHLIARLKGQESMPEPSEVPEVDLPEIPFETKRAAMKAFRRRIKLMRLDHESKLGVGPMTSGKKADFDSILPPRDFDDDVWKALAAEGQLNSTGRGFYGLPKD
jgi:hypothetical protein